VHGDIFTTKCGRGDFSRKETSDDDLGNAATGVPRCPRCGARLRPRVVWFGEGLSPHEVARVDNFVRARPCDVVIVVGTTVAFDYIVHWTRLAANDAATQLIEVNPDDRFMETLGAEWVKEPASIALPAEDRGE
jgi:NAD-dependent deacetylase